MIYHFENEDIAIMRKVTDLVNSRIRTESRICHKHAKPTHYIKDLVTGESFCPLCKKENELDPANNKQLTQWGQELITKSYRNYLKKESLTGRKDVFKCTFDNFQHSKPYENQAFEQARKIAGFYYANPNKEGNSLLFGNAGSGKTHLAMAILNAVNANSKNPMQKCLFISMTALVSEMRDRISDPTVNVWSAKHVENVVKEADLVVIDDLGAESVDKVATNFVQGTIQDLCDDNQRIIFTTNLNMDELRATYHDRLVSRFLEGSKGKIIDFTKIEDKRMWK